MNKTATRRHNLKRTAYHEAGHAVMAMAKGCALRRISIRPRGDLLGSTMAGTRRVGPVADQKNIAVALAGHIGEQMAVGKLAAAALEGSLDDMTAAYKLMRRRGFKTHAAQEQEYWRVGLAVHDELRARWRAVRALARALLEREHLSGKEARRIIREALETQ
jgi:ATP-dependent Zn protease